MAFDLGFRALPPGVADLLLAAGTQSSLTIASLFDGAGDLGSAFFEVFGEEIPDADLEKIQDEMEDFDKAMECVRAEAARQRGRVASATSADLILHMEGSGGARKRKELEDSWSAASAAAVVEQAPPPPGWTPPLCGRRGSSDGN